MRNMPNWIDVDHQTKAMDQRVELLSRCIDEVGEMQLNCGHGGCRPSHSSRIAELWGVLVPHVGFAAEGDRPLDANVEESGDADALQLFSSMVAMHLILT